MPTTSNFGWTTPADTDLVKDGALAIRTLANGVDTSFLDLKGGTTGQVLSKTSATDLDFTWVTTDDANAIQNAIVDAKGDLIAASAADTPARLPVGSNGQVLIAASGETTGLKWGVDPTTDVVTTAGDLIYGTAADTVARLGIGTAGQILQVNSGATAPEWATPAAGGGMTLINTGGTALTGASVTVSSIPGTYKDLYVIMEDVYEATTNGGVKMRFNSDTGTNYYFSYVRNINTTVAGFSSGTTSLQLETRVGSTNTNYKKGQLAVSLPRYTNTSPKAMHSQSYGHDDTNSSNLAVSGVYIGGSAISSITVFGDYNFSGGTIYVYGVN
jgi:hypothetical protein